MTSTFIGQHKFSVDNGVTVARPAGDVRIGPGGHLVAASLELEAGPPVLSVLSFAQGPVGMNLVKGWVRGPTFGQSGGLVWHGDIDIGEAG